MWAGYRGGRDDAIDDVSTGVERTRLAELLQTLARVRDGFHLHPKLERGFTERRAMAAGERPVDWAAAEALAFATLAVEGTPVRLTGQDTERGTFGQRHAVLHDVETGETWRPLQHLAEGQAPVEIWNSPLSEMGVLGFEYGYSLDRPEALVLWEAQYGDFVNAAQVVIDQFLASAEDKWRRLSGLGLLLPHGYEGRGPEHSSARLERFLQLAAEDNIQIVQPTTPAQYFHVLRRQVVRPLRKPLIVLTPKSLLRHKLSVSSLDELASGRFQRVIPDARQEAPPVTRVLLCSGKIYFELLERRDALKRYDVAIAAARAAPSLAARGAARRARRLPRRHARGLGPGGAGEPGRLALRRAQVPRRPVRPSAARGHRALGVGQPGHRLACEPSARAARAARRRVRRRWRRLRRSVKGRG